jgi:hypothetical protein
MKLKSFGWLFAFAFLAAVPATHAQLRGTSPSIYVADSPVPDPPSGGGGGGIISRIVADSPVPDPPSGGGGGCIV